MRTRNHAKVTNVCVVYKFFITIQYTYDISCEMFNNITIAKRRKKKTKWERTTCRKFSQSESDSLCCCTVLSVSEFFKFYFSYICYICCVDIIVYLFFYCTLINSAAVTDAQKALLLQLNTMKKETEKKVIMIEFSVR